MALSGVWENITLSKTPTFDGVCGMLAYLPMCYVDGIWYSQHFDVGCEPLDVIGRCSLPCGCDIGMADDFCHCGIWNSHILLLLWQMENYILR